MVDPAKNVGWEPQVVDSDRCGAPTRDGSPCKRRTDGPKCWQHDTTLPDGLPDAPEHLGTHGSKLWREEVKSCADNRILGQMSLSYLENMCEALDVRRNLWPDVKRGATIPGRDGTDKTNPAVAKHRKYTTEFRQCAKEWEKMKREATPEADNSEGGIGQWL